MTLNCQPLKRRGPEPVEENIQSVTRISTCPKKILASIYVNVHMASLDETLMLQQLLKFKISTIGMIIATHDSASQSLLFSEHNVILSPYKILCHIWSVQYVRGNSWTNVNICCITNLLVFSRMF